MKKNFLLLSVFAFITSCATFNTTTSSTQNVRVEIETPQKGELVFYNNQFMGQTPCAITLPLVANYQVNSVSRGFKVNATTVTTYKNWTLKFVNQYGASREVTYNPGDLAVINGVYQIKDKIQPKITDPTIMVGEENNMVTRDNPGQTGLEKTIIRWRVDSYPQGARIFWRVISNIPQIVKNTNETYLMTTPYEETRAFNILGLSYENSRNVQIEFRVSKSGYEDQIKRFNVRQAIDQQEISTFFELVPKESNVE